jgi:hypothetical protein
MVRVTLGALFLALSFGAAVHAADQPIYNAPPPWVRSLPIPTDGKASGAAVDVLLWTSQSRLSAGATETFVERAVRINSPEGLGSLGSLSEVWDPATETLTIHRARILRAGKVIDLLADGHRFTVLRRETNLEAASIDGALTATLQPEGLRVGDVLDFAVSRVEREPALADHAEAATSLHHVGAIGRLFVSMSWPSPLPVRAWKTDDIPGVAPVAHGAWTELDLDQTNATSPDPPRGAPAFDQMLGVLQASDLGTWKTVSLTAYPLYERAATLKPGSPLLAEAARIKAASADPKAQALDYPAYTRTDVEVQLPNDGKRFEVFNGGRIDSTVGGSTYARAAAISNGRLTVLASAEAIAPTFPASQAASTQAALRDLASYDVSLSYTPASAEAAVDSNAKIRADASATIRRIATPGLEQGSIGPRRPTI